MEKQTLAMLGRWRPVRSVVVAILLAGLLGIVPYLAQPQYQTEVATALEQILQPICLAGVVSSIKNRAGVYGGRSVEPMNLPAGHFVLDHGYGAHPPDEYYVIESRNPKVHGRCCALVRRVSV